MTGAGEGYGGGMDRTAPASLSLPLALGLVALLLLPACSGRRLKGGWETDPSGKDPCGVVASAAELDTGYVRMGGDPDGASVGREVSVSTAKPVGNTPVAQQSFRGPRAPRPRGRNVNLRKEDLAGVDHWLSARNSQWVLGDTVDVYASKEYFSTMLTLNAKVGTVQRQDKKVGEDHLVVMRFLGGTSNASAMHNPRAQIGPGLTVTARKVLRVRMAKSRDPRFPVQLRIVATGKAAHGKGEEALRRDDQIELGGTLGYAKDHWLWRAYSR